MDRQRDCSRRNRPPRQALKHFPAMLWLCLHFLFSGQNSEEMKFWFWPTVSEETSSPEVISLNFSRQVYLHHEKKVDATGEPSEAAVKHPTPVPQIPNQIQMIVFEAHNVSPRASGGVCARWVLFLFIGKIPEEMKELSLPRVPSRVPSYCPSVSDRIWVRILMHQIPAMLEQYRGNENALMQSICAKYGLGDFHLHQKPSALYYRRIKHIYSQVALPVKFVVSRGAEAEQKDAKTTGPKSHRTLKHFPAMLWLCLIFFFRVHIIRKWNSGFGLRIQ